jgi:uncharacterized protein YpmS
MWKKAFIVLLSLNLFVIVLFTLWFGSLPKASKFGSGQAASDSTGKPAPIQLSVGEQAINAYLEYAIAEEPDVKRVLSYAKVKFDDKWSIQLGIKLADRVVAFDTVISPSIHNGNLGLRIETASMGEVPLPVNALLFLFRNLPWPNWIQIQPETNTLELNFSERPQKPYGVRVLNYSPVTKMLTVLVTIVPRSVLKHGA